jgi:hypothetical protein
MQAFHILGLAALLGGAVGMAPTLVAHQPPAAAGGQADPVAALKQSIGEGTRKLAQYEWVETTVIKLKGEEKGRKLNRCYYGADGKVQKVPMDQPAAPAPAEAGGRGRRRGGGALKEKVIEHKKDELQEYMQQAAALMHSYVPPAPPQIQAVKDGGRLTATPQAGGALRLELAQYLKPGDALTIDLEPAASRLLGLAVNSYLDQPDEPVTLTVQMNTLPDGALYAAQTTLDAKAKNIQVVITNAGHKPMAR